MLGFFVVLAVSFAHAMLTIDSMGQDRFDFIIVGGGPAGAQTIDVALMKT